MIPPLFATCVILAMELASAAPTPAPTDLISFWCGTPGADCMNDENWEVCRDLVDRGCQDILMMESCPLQFDCGSWGWCGTPGADCMNDENWEVCRDLVDRGCQDILMMESCPLQFDCGSWGYKAPEPPTLTRAECADAGGTVVGDPGDGSVLAPGYVCPPGSAAGGEPPMGTIRYEVGDPFASEGEVCCPSEEEELSQTPEPSPGPTSEPTTSQPTTFEPTTSEPTTSEPTTSGPTSFEPNSETPTFEPTHEPTSRNAPSSMPSPPPVQGDAPRSDPTALSGNSSVGSSARHLLSLVVSAGALLLTTTAVYISVT